MYPRRFVLRDRLVVLPSRNRVSVGDSAKSNTGTVGGVLAVLDGGVNLEEFAGQGAIDDWAGSESNILKAQASNAAASTGSVCEALNGRTIRDRGAVGNGVGQDSLWTDVELLTSWDLNIHLDGAVLTNGKSGCGSLWAAGADAVWARRGGSSADPESIVGGRDGGVLDRRARVDGNESEGIGGSAGWDSGGRSSGGQGGGDEGSGTHVDSIKS